MALVHEGCGTWEKTQQAPFDDTCLAPYSGVLCDDMQNQRMQGTGPMTADNKCWRVSVPLWWQPSLMLPCGSQQLLIPSPHGGAVAPQDACGFAIFVPQEQDACGAALYQQGNEAHAASDNFRDASPEPCYDRSPIGQLPPPVLRAAFHGPLDGGGSGLLAGSVLGRKPDRRRRRGAAGGFAPGGRDEDWETGSQVSEFSISSYASSRGNRRASGPVYVAEHLHWLESQDSKKVCRLKKIHKLGFEAPGILKSYFEQWGPVERVLLSNMPVNSQGKSPAKPVHMPGVRIRPAGMGWVVMSSAEDAQRLLEHGDHTVQGLPISVLPYTPKSQEQTPPSSIAEAAEEDEEQELDNKAEEVEDILRPLCTQKLRWSDIH